MAITTANLMELKRQVGEVRDNVIKANATMKEVTSNIESLEQELKELGINDVSTVEAEIEAMETQVKELYDKALTKIQKWV